MQEMFHGDPNGVHIVALRRDPEKWAAFVYEQAEHLRSCEENYGGGYVFGYYQHPKLQPMYGRGGNTAFQTARDDWYDAVNAELRKTPLQHLTEEVFRK